ncbi:TorF family putative porin [Oceanobacter mangrovi]|uniref:TorF family putative porin n=1 Tax=Oceanobacter mangrovi TaxID=2862510 RepID=UPI001C8EA28C|nr:TorF family putative porin [Oceanobacter mangrovi]
MKKLSQVIAITGALTAGVATVQTAQAEISASVDIASMYLWRGVNLGDGTPVVSGSLDYSHESGLYAGVWTSSGDTSYGTETDFYVGFAGEAGSVGYDVGYATYIYPDSSDPELDKFDDSAEYHLGLSYDMASLTLYKSSDFDVDGFYGVIGVDVPDTSFSVALGSTFDMESNNWTHLDVTYAFNDSVAFTVSKIVAEDLDKGEDGFLDKSAKYVVSYSLPIEM